MGKIALIILCALGAAGCCGPSIKVPVSVPCVVDLPAEPPWPLAALSLSITAAALQPGDEYLILDPAMATIRLQRAHIKALRRAIAPCVDPGNIVR